MKLCCWMVLLCGTVLTLTAGCDNEPPLPTLSPDPASLPAPPALTERETTAPAIEPPHGGRLLAMPDNRGYVEWVIDAGRLYLVDSAATPARGAENVVLTVQTATGPRELPLTPCEEAGFEGACWTNPAPELKNPDTAGVVRLLLEGQPLRVAMGTQPAPASTDLPVFHPAEAIEKP